MRWNPLGQEGGAAQFRVSGTFFFLIDVLAPGAYVRMCRSSLVTTGL